MLSEQQKLNLQRQKHLIALTESANQALEQEFEATIESLFTRYLSAYGYEQYKNEVEQRNQLLSEEQLDSIIVTLLTYIFAFFNFRKSSNSNVIEMSELIREQSEWEKLPNNLSEEEINKIRNQYFNIFSKIRYFDIFSESNFSTVNSRSEQEIKALMENTQVYQQIKALESLYSKNILHNQNSLNESLSYLLFFHKCLPNGNETKSLENNLENKLSSKL